MGNFIVDKSYYLIGIMIIAMLFCFLNKDDCGTKIEEFIIKRHVLAVKIIECVKKIIEEKNLRYDEKKYSIVDEDGNLLVIFEQDSVDAIKEE
jgi:hypothetical protein